ncbi:MAG: formylglycine-generating enzyme family protein [Saprospiraceae bacterium]|nr:formylglycine-generating enzyme family protein [Saprospiraceae bacterium]
MFIVLNASAIAQPPMVLVPGGSFLRGSLAGDSDEKPQKAVAVDSFWMAVTETTLESFSTFVEATGYVTDAEKRGASYVWDSLGWRLMEGVHWRHDERGRLRAAGKFPVLHVSWNDAAQYCNWLSRNAGLEQVYVFEGSAATVNITANGYRLPTEAEWEYAAGGGVYKNGPFAGEGKLDSLAWYSGNARRRAHEVQGKRPNALGLYDMTGNVWEWCQDYYDADFYKNTNSKAPAVGTERVLRGGSWNNAPKHCRIQNRSSRFADFSDGNVGFRVCRLK